MRYSVPDYLKIDAARTTEAIVSFIRAYLEASGASGVVLGLSGGTDSAVVASLAVRSLGVNRVTALMMPDRESPEENVHNSEELGRALGLRLVKVDITDAVSTILSLLGNSYDTSPRLAKGNVKARVRMTMLYYIANKTNSLVLGSSNRSEWLLGYFTKWGDGAADLYPIINLYKTQVRLLGDYLGIPERINWRPSSPDLWPGHRASDELGADYDIIDPVLHLYIDKGLRVEEISRTLNIGVELVSKIVSRISLTEHKRRLVMGPPPFPAH